MKLTIEQGNDPILKSSYYSLKIGTRVYHYEKLQDILYRIAVIFEPPQEITKPERIIKVPKRKGAKRPKKFPLGNTIVEVLNGTVGYVSLDALRKGIKTPKPYSRSIWGMVLSKLAKKKAIKVVVDDGETRYGGMGKK